MGRSCLLAEFFFSASFAQSQNEKDITTVLYQSASDWNKGSLEGFMKSYWNNDSLMYVGSKGVTYGYNNILNSYKKSFPDTAAMGNLSFDILHVKRLSAEYYYVVGKYTVVRTMGNAEGHFTLVFRKIDGKWVIVSDHSS